jgi:hypothetical protein
MVREVSTYAVRCGACGERFEGGVETLRAVIWPHRDTHRLEEFPLTHDGERALFEGEPIILSCNCGECDFCREKARA